MKERTALGLGIRKCCDIISFSHEDTFFKDGLLGDQNPVQLLNTVIYMLCLHCTLRGGVEQNSVEWLFVVNLISYVTTTKGNQNPAFLMQYFFIQAVTKQMFILKCSILNSPGFREASV